MAGYRSGGAGGKLHPMRVIFVNPAGNTGLAKANQCRKLMLTSTSKDATKTGAAFLVMKSAEATQRRGGPRSNCPRTLLNAFTLISTAAFRLVAKGTGKF